MPVNLLPITRHLAEKMGTPANDILTQQVTDNGESRRPLQQLGGLIPELRIVAFILNQQSAERQQVAHVVGPAILPELQGLLGHFALDCLGNRQRTCLEKLSGILLNETDDRLTVLEAGGVETEVLRRDVVSLWTGGLSTMPEELEVGLELQALADLLAYLQEPR